MWFKVKLDTNGRDPVILQKLLDCNLLDYIAVDIKNPIWKFSELICVDESEQNYTKSIQILLNSKINYEFRTTVIKWFHDEKSIENICKTISWAKNYYLQNYRSGKTLDPNFKWESFNTSNLNIFKNIADNYVNNCGIRE
jgi:pyruvate formate lyase activating enzyme